MDEISLPKLIDQAQDAIRPFEHSQSTTYHYQLAWRVLADYFHENNQDVFSLQLAQQFMIENKAKYDAGTMKKWRYKLYRVATRRLIEFYEQGYLTWNYQKHTLATQIYQPNYVFLQKNYLDNLKKEGKSNQTLQFCETISRQFLAFLEQKEINDIAKIHRNDVSQFILFISKRYQPTSIRTAFSALRSFFRFTESQKLTSNGLNNAIPSSWGRKTAIIPTITSAEEQKLLGTVDRKTPLGKRNYAMFLLAIRTGLRSIDITNLKLRDIHWNSSTIEVLQKKTNTLLVLPLLSDVGNAIADYILNGRPDSQSAYLFLRSQAPFVNLSGRSVCYGISSKMMKEAGVRQSQGDRKGFHCLRHSLAARLLSEETPLPVIASILGHQDKESTKVYLSADLKHLRLCALTLKGIEVDQEKLR